MTAWKCERASGAQDHMTADEPLRDSTHLPIVATLFVARGGATARVVSGVEDGDDERSNLVRLTDAVTALRTVNGALASAQRELAEARKLCGQKHDEANRYVNEMVLLKVRAEKAEARVAELEAALAMSAAREAGLRANLDIICSHARKIELAVSRGAIGPEEGSDGR